MRVCHVYYLFCWTTFIYILKFYLFYICFSTSIYTYFISTLIPTSSLENAMTAIISLLHVQINIFNNFMELTGKVSYISFDKNYVSLPCKMLPTYVKRTKDIMVKQFPVLYWQGFESCKRTSDSDVQGDESLLQGSEVIHINFLNIVFILK